MDIATTLDGKFFINHVQSRQGTLLMRGKIVGPIGSEYSPYYLCDLFPADDTEIGITSQTLLSLDQLTGVYLYHDKVTQDAAWDALQRQCRAEKIARQKTEDAQDPQVMYAKLPSEVARALGIMGITPPPTEKPGTPEEDKEDTG